MILMTTYFVLLLAYLENSFYMMREEIYHKCKFLKFFKMIFYFALMVIIGIVNGLSITQVRDQRDFGMNQEPHTAQIVLLCIVGIMLLLWALLMIAAIIYACLRIRRLYYKDMLHFSIHATSVIFFVVCLFVGAFTPNF